MLEAVILSEDKTCSGKNGNRKGRTRTRDTVKCRKLGELSHCWRKVLQNEVTYYGYIDSVRMKTRLGNLALTLTQWRGVIMIKSGMGCGGFQGSLGFSLLDELSSFLLVALPCPDCGSAFRAVTLGHEQCAVHVTYDESAGEKLCTRSLLAHPS